MATDKHVLHLDLDTFFVSVERLLDPKLVGKPVIVGGGKRGVVSACSYETRPFGVHSALPMYQALKLCPQAIVVKGNMQMYSYYSKMVTDIIREEAPKMEKSSIDEFYIDLTGMERFFGALKWAVKLRKRIIDETGLPISFGLAANKMVAKVATGQGKPMGEVYVKPGTEKAFLAPLPIHKIPGLGPKVCEQLSNLGFHKNGDISQLSLEEAITQIGPQGEGIWKRCSGLHDSEVVTHWDAKSVSNERTFHEDLSDPVQMKSIIAALVEKSAFRLRNKEKITGCVAVKIRYNDFSTHTRQGHIDYTASDSLILKKVYELFDQAYEKGRPVRLLGVRLSHLVTGSYQANLFDDTPQTIQLYQQMDKIKAKYGADKLRHALTLDTISSRPEVTSFAKE